MDERTTIADLERRLAAAEVALSEKAGVEADLRRSEELRRLAVEGGGMGTWRSNLREQVISGDAAFMGFWGLSSTDEPRPYAQFLDRMSPHGRDLMSDMIASTPRAGEVFDGEHEVVVGPTAGRWVRWRGCAEREHPWIVNGICFDVTDQRRSEECLRESEARHRMLIETWTQAVWETDPAGVVVADSPSWRAYTGQTLQEWLGYGWLDAIHPEDRAYAERKWRQGVATCGLVDVELRLRAPDDSWRWTNILAAPVRDAQGGIEKWVGMNVDIDARRTAEMALREGEKRYRELFDRIDEGFCIIEMIFDGDTPVDYRFLVVNPAFEHHTGIADAEGRSMREIAPAHEQHWFDRYGEIARTGRPERFEAPAKALGDRWYDLNAFRIGEPDQRRVAIVFSDVTQRRRDAAALRESEERFAQFAAASSDALWIRNATTLAMEYSSPAIQAIYGITPDGILGDVSRWVALILPEDRDTAVAHIEMARSGASVTHEFRIVRPSDGEVRWIRNTDFPLRDAHGRVQRIGGIAEDVTEAVRSSKRQEVLVNELQHRARNLLGVVTALVDRTVKRGGSVEAFEERLQALSRAQGLLSKGGSDTVEVGALVRAELAAYIDDASDRVTVSGPEVLLTARQVQNFALAVHELATNAVKYGALKGETGRLTVSWEVALDRRERRRLALSWIESGVEVPPAGGMRRGYGTELIREALAYALQAEIEYALGEDGVQCRIGIPVS